MTPTKITLEKFAGNLQLKVTLPGTLRGYTVIESVPFRTGASIPTLIKHAQKYAKRFAIPFVNTIEG
jgi:hypothetical protein